MTTTDESVVKGIVVSSGTSFFWGMKILSYEQRRAMFALYAFCRKIDDIADNQQISRNEKLREISLWEKKINCIFTDNEINDPVSREISLAIKKFNLKKSDLSSLIQGMKMDIEKNIQFPTREELELYCDRVAVAVGYLSIKIFGVNSIVGRKYAHYLGRAFQFTNIVRDFHEDLKILRCYIPKDILKQNKIPQKMTNLLYSPNLSKVLQDLLEEAEQYFLKAEEISFKLDKDKIRASQIMKLFYKTIHNKMYKRNFDLKKKIKLNFFEKIIIFLKILI
tara:strand:- start:553 stop:1389 length:837 start_codon:yes stop_codon:yes gene_type:complete